MILKKQGYEPRSVVLLAETPTVTINLTAIEVEEAPVADPTPVPKARPRPKAKPKKTEAASEPKEVTAPKANPKTKKKSGVINPFGDD